MLKVVLVAFLVAFLQSMIVEATWKKISHFPICFEGRDNKPGHFMYTGDEIIAGALKLEWASGSIRCVSDNAYDSRWGCHQHSTFRAYPFNVIVTDGKDKIIFPLKQYIKHTSGLWYYLPAQDDKESKSIVFTNFQTPLFLHKMMQLKLWYGEDLKNWSETDNQGRVCVNIYAFILNPSGAVSGGGGGGGGGAANSAATKLLTSLKTSLNAVLKS